jgi:hypothetical protein
MMLVKFITGFAVFLLLDAAVAWLADNTPVWIEAIGTSLFLAAIPFAVYQAVKFIGKQVTK